MSKKGQETSSTRQMTCAEVLKHPEYPYVTWDLKPQSQGRLEVAKDRDGPLKIGWEIHGKGPIRLVWIMGLGALKSAWQRQTKDFSHTRENEFSSFIFDNRGLGDSDHPFGRYSTSNMAKDLIECLDHVDWTRTRQLHVIGLSMGGMIALELALLIPERIASLSLVGTCSVVKNHASYIDQLRNMMDMMIPRSIDYEFSRTKRNMLSANWQYEVDESEYVVKPFPTNGDRLLAGELTKRLDVARYTKRGFYSQVLAAIGHNVTAPRLAELGDKVGRERIMCVHGTKDMMIQFANAEVLFEGLGGESGGVTKHFIEGQGHVIPVEMRTEFNSWVEQLVMKAEDLNKKEVTN